MNKIPRMSFVTKLPRKDNFKINIFNIYIKNILQTLLQTDLLQPHCHTLPLHRQYKSLSLDVILASLPVPVRGADQPINILDLKNAPFVNRQL